MAVFMAPIKEDIQNLARILHGFGEVTWLQTNFHKSLVVPIWCGHLDLENILEGQPAIRTSFHVRYLGLPLSVWQSRRIDFQHLEDKIAVKFVPREGMNITSAGHGVLVKSILNSQTIHHLMPLAIPPPILKSINKVEKAFLWSRTDKVTGGSARLIGRPFAGPPTTITIGNGNMTPFWDAPWLHGTSQKTSPCPSSKPPSAKSGKSAWP